MLAYVLCAPDDETLERLGLLGGYDDDLAHDVNRAANRLRDMLLAISPALERVLEAP